jgi:hypothetical protein
VSQLTHSPLVDDTSGTPRPTGAPCNLYVREDYLLDLLPRMLTDLPDQNSQQDLVNILRQERLQVTCTDQGPVLRQEKLTDGSSQVDAHEQAALELEWTPQRSTKSWTHTVSAHLDPEGE